MLKFMRSMGPIVLPAIAAVGAGCRGTQPRLLFATRHFHCRAPIPAAPAALTWCAIADSTIDRAGRLLAVPPPKTSTEIRVFHSTRRFRRFIAGHDGNPDWQAATIVEAGRIVIAVRYNRNPQRMSAAVRHETIHALLAATASSVPAWLHEGLAVYFENNNQDGSNRQALQRFRRLAAVGRGPALDDVRNSAALTPDHRALAWARIYWLLNHEPDGPARLRRYLAAIRTAASNASLRPPSFETLAEQLVCTKKPTSPGRSCPFITR